MAALPASGPSRKPYTACFSVFAIAEPSVMPRVLEVFAKRGLIPATWHSAVCGAHGEELHIDVQLAGFDPPVTERLAQDLRRVISVDCVLTSEKRYAMTA